MSGGMCVQVGVRDVASAVPGALQSRARALAVQFRSMYPLAVPPTLDQTSAEFAGAIFYRVKPDKWLNDAIIRAFCERLESVYAGVRYAGITEAKQSTVKGSRNQKLNDALRGRLVGWAADESVKTILLPINFGILHWACFILDTAAKQIKYYNSLNKVGCRKPLDDLAQNLETDSSGAFKDFTLVASNSPLQQDGYSCGLFVCFKFWREMDKEITDMSKFKELTRRLEFIYFILHGHKIE